MQPQAKGLHDAVGRAWEALAGFIRRTDLGPAVKLAYGGLWFSLGCRPGCYDLTLASLGAAFGCTHRAAAKWLDKLVELGLVERVSDDAGRIRVYVYGPDEAGRPRRVAGDPQQSFPGFDEADAAVVDRRDAALPMPAAAIDSATVDSATVEGGPFGAQTSAADLSVPKGPDLSAHKGPPTDDELAAVVASLNQRRQALNIREHPPPARLGGGPFGTERSELRAQSSSINEFQEELRAPELARFGAETSAADMPPADRSPPLRLVRTARPPDNARRVPAESHGSPVERVLSRTSSDAAADYRRRRDGLIAEITRRIPEVRPSVARNVVDGVLGNLFEWSDVERMFDAAAQAQVPWQYFVAAAKQKYRDVKARWPSWHRQKA